MSTDVATRFSKDVPSAYTLEGMVKTMEKIRVCPVCGFVGYAEDAVEVVRCKDCRYYSVMGETTRFGFCGYRHAGTDETDYCSRAERRDESEVEE